jgi:hypothetical protein
MKRASAFVFSLALAASIHAGTITTFGTLSSFDAAVGPTTTETFDVAPQCIFLTGALSSSGVTCSGGGSVAPGDIQSGVSFSVPSAGYSKSFAIDSGGVLGSNHILDSDIGGRLAPGTTPLTAAFSTAISGVGFEEYNIDGATTLTAILNFTGGGSVTDNETLTGAFTQFFGFESSVRDISSIVIDTNGTHYEFAVDNFAFTTSAVPEPKSLGLLAAALAALGYYSYRRRSASSQAD